MRVFTDGDVSRALSLLPSPYFRPRDIYPVAKQIGYGMERGQSLWERLRKDGLIVRTGIQIGKAARRFYWERVPAAMPQHEARVAL